MPVRRAILEDVNPAVDGNDVIFLRVNQKRTGRTLAKSRIPIRAGNARPLKHFYEDDFDRRGRGK